MKTATATVLRDFDYIQYAYMYYRNTSENSPRHQYRWWNSCVVGHVTQRSKLGLACNPLSTEAAGFKLRSPFHARIVNHHIFFLHLTSAVTEYLGFGLGTAIESSVNRNDSSRVVKIDFSGHKNIRLYIKSCISATKNVVSILHFHCWSLWTSAGRSSASKSCCTRLLIFMARHFSV